ncbi:hypothetical protein U9M48_000953 [Paspalum notatum var. saurae]|uniref:Uncharacterized protein n=1 Tax=Paspalum notatum var. saurae TaxID=547442 RepID=A0AAQ3PMM5_PASNO
MASSRTQIQGEGQQKSDGGSGGRGNEPVGRSLRRTQTVGGRAERRRALPCTAPPRLASPPHHPLRLGPGTASPRCRPAPSPAPLHLAVAQPPPPLPAPVATARSPPERAACRHGEACGCSAAALVDGGGVAEQRRHGARAVASPCARPRRAASLQVRGVPGRRQKRCGTGGGQRRYVVPAELVEPLGRPSARWWQLRNGTQASGADEPHRPRIRPLPHIQVVSSPSAIPHIDQVNCCCLHCRNQRLEQDKNRAAVVTLNSEIQPRSSRRTCHLVGILCPGVLKCSRQQKATSREQSSQGSGGGGEGKYVEEATCRGDGDRHWLPPVEDVAPVGGGDEA